MLALARSATCTHVEPDFSYMQYPACKALIGAYGEEVSGAIIMWLISGDFFVDSAIGNAHEGEAGLALFITREREGGVIWVRVSTHAARNNDSVIEKSGHDFKEGRVRGLDVVRSSRQLDPFNHKPNPAIISTSRPRTSFAAGLANSRTNVRPNLSSGRSEHRARRRYNKPLSSVYAMRQDEPIAKSPGARVCKLSDL